MMDILSASGAKTVFTTLEFGSLVIFEAALIFASSECDILTTLRAFIIQGLCKCEEMMMFIFVM